jgi:hypothetical protein
MKDPIVEEVRRVRHELECELDNDPKRIYEHLRRVQARYAERVVSRQPKRLPSVAEDRGKQ